jgi:hypothetical protein
MFDQRGQHVGREHVDREDVRQSVCRRDPARLAIADPGVVDHGVERSELACLLSNLPHASEHREITGHSTASVRRCRPCVVGPVAGPPVQDDLVALFDQELPSH